MHASVNPWKNSRSINSKGFGRRGAMNGALITTEMSGEEGEGVCIYPLLHEISNQRGCILGELAMKFFCASKEGACPGFPQQFLNFFFSHIQLKFWKMSSWHCSFLASATLFGVRQDTSDKSLPQFDQVVEGHLETSSEISEGKVQQGGAADPKGLTPSKPMEEPLQNPSYLIQFHFL